MPSTVIFDSDCGICQRARRLTEALDWFRALRWLPQQDPAATVFGIADADLQTAMYLVTSSGRSYRGFDAVQQILLRVPAVYASAAMMVWKQPAAAIPIALFFSPWSKPIGDRAYDWVASNRYRFPGVTCRHMNANVQVG